MVKDIDYEKRKRFVFRIIAGIVESKGIAGIVRVRNWLNLIFTGVAPLISYIDMNFKIIFSTQFFLYNCFYFQCLLSQNTVNVIFQCLLSQIPFPIVFSSFNSVNGFKITT